MDADAHFHLICAKIEVRLARGRDSAGRQRDAHRARPAVDGLAQGLKIRPAHAFLGRGADDFLDDERAGDAASARRIGRRLDRDVVIDDDGRASTIGHFCRHLEIHHIALVILDDEDDARALVDGFHRRRHLVRRGRSEDLSRAGGVQHAEADEARMQRLMSGPASRDQRYLARRQGSAANKFPPLADEDDVRMRCCEAIEAFIEQRLVRIEKLLHRSLATPLPGFKSLIHSLDRHAESAGRGVAPCRAPAHRTRGSSRRGRNRSLRASSCVSSIRYGVAGVDWDGRA